MNKMVLKDNKLLDNKIDIEEDTYYELINEENTNNKLEFNISDNSCLKVNIFDAAKEVNRTITINLNGINSEVELNLSVLSLKENNYEININHNNKNTTSNTNLHGLALKDNRIFFKNNGKVVHGSKNSKLVQDNKIIIMNDNNSKIEPNLYIDEYDVEASHGAYIGKFKEEDVFYLQTRGLTKKECYDLLIGGFLFGEFEENLMNIVEKNRG